MFAYIKGELEIKSESFIVIGLNGIGYKIFMSLNSIEKLPDIGEVVKVHTHYYVREDSISLYGFKTGDELRMFELLMTISGIGAKSAIKILSSISPSDFAMAIISDDDATLMKLPGIGKKSAGRIILELKDKLLTEDAIDKNGKKEINESGNSILNDAKSALLVLGYSKKEIDLSFREFSQDKLDLEEIIKTALNYLGK